MTNVPWFERTHRWGQTNLTEIDPSRYDSRFWREQWRRTEIQGVIINAGGIVAFYPSENPLHYRASHLGGRDLYGDIVRDAREEGLTVIARMDSNRATADFYREHPDWFTRDRNGRPYMAADRYIACVNSEYYDEYLPSIIREVIARSHPDGFADNSWAGLDARRICFCRNCTVRFRDAYGGDLPERVDFDDPTFRVWLRWNESRRTDVWRQNSRVTAKAGGPDCLWVGMIHGPQAALTNRFVNVRDVAHQSKILFVDNQRRSAPDGFLLNAEVGSRLHGVLGWDRLLPESMAMYSAGHGFFRATSMPGAEVWTWAASGFAGGIQPWWHHISAVHEDHRQYATAQPLFQWHRVNENLLLVSAVSEKSP
ncbi:beta-galactosidase [Saccharomonospora sp. NPDC046836]|uniref:beta-galactosidase n=1 Tax=Saccharomonospora sp. NPDC046836 TaxID=3156921 RepID=UPI003402461C